MYIIPFKNNTRFKDLYTRYLNEFIAAATSGNTRIVLPAQYQLDNGPSVWATYPTTVYSTPYQSYNAICDKNGGSC